MKELALMLPSSSTAVLGLTIGSLFCVGSALAPPQKEDEVRKTELSKEAANWHYPKATDVGSGETEGKMYQSILMTMDDLEKVLKFYENKSGQVLSLKKSETKTGVYLTGTDVVKGEGIATILADDSGQPPDPRKQGAPSRGVIIRLLTQNREKYFVSIMISHADNEKETHVVVTYLKK
jgi:hypothetical protein